MFTLKSKHLNTRVKLIKKKFLIKIWFLKDLLLIFNLQMYKFYFYFDRIFFNYLWICFFHDPIIFHMSSNSLFNERLNYLLTSLLHDLIFVVYVLESFHQLSCHTHWFSSLETSILALFWHQFYGIANWSTSALDLDRDWRLRSDSLASYSPASKWVSNLSIMYFTVLYTIDLHILFFYSQVFQHSITKFSIRLTCSHTSELKQN